MRTAHILCRIQEHDSNNDRSSVDRFFHHPVVVWSLAKSVAVKDANPGKSWDELRQYLSRLSEVIPAPFLTKRSRDVHERLLFFMLERQKESYDTLLLAEGDVVDKMTHAILAIFFERWEYLPKLKDELLVKANVKLLLRLLCGTSDFQTQKEKILGAQTILDDFTYRRTVCFAAGAHGKRDLCYFFAKVYPDYSGYTIQGAKQFGWNKLAQRLEPTIAVKKEPQVQKVTVVHYNGLFLVSLACSFICLLLATLTGSK